MRTTWEWLVQNRTWVFSGIGVTALLVLGTIFRRLWKPIAGDDSSKQPININVSPTISPTFSQTQAVAQAASTGSERLPDLKALACKAVFAPAMGGTGRSCFVLAIRNDGLADASNVIAHIGFIGASGQRFLVDYASWLEHEPILNIPRGHTKNVILAVSEGNKNFAVTDLGPPTNYTVARLEEVGEVTSGNWNMILTLSADNFRREYSFDLEVTLDGSLLCIPEGMNRIEPRGRKSADLPQPNVGSLRPEVTTLIYDEESDVWSKGSGINAVPSALLPFVNEPSPPKKTASVEGLRARLTFYEKDRIEEFRRIDSGCWLNEAYRFLDMHVGDIAYLIAAVQIKGVGGSVENPRYSSSRYSEDHIRIDHLPAGEYEMKVELFGGSQGEYAETYWFLLEVNDQLRVKRINQRPMALGG